MCIQSRRRAHTDKVRCTEAPREHLAPVVNAVPVTTDTKCMFGNMYIRTVTTSQHIHQMRNEYEKNNENVSVQAGQNLFRQEKKKST